MKAIKYIFLISILTAASSCKKYVDVDPSRTELAQSSVFVNDKTATAAMVGVYSDMNAYNYYFANIITMFLGSMSADDFTYASTLAEFDEFKNNTVSPGNRYISQVWSQPYDYIYRSNAIIEGVTASTTLSTSVKNQLLGEAKFVRAFCNFYLVNIFGDVPLIKDTDVLKNTNLPKTPATEVYQAIITDLVDAKALMSKDYPSNGERTRPTKGAATLLLARAYLYTGNNAQAEIEAGEVIGNSNYNLLPKENINGTFLKNSREAIWQLQPVNVSGNRNTWEGFTMTPASITAPTAFYRLTKDPQYGLVFAFEPNDLRKSSWTGNYTTTAVPPLTHTYPYKYKVRTNAAVTEYSMVLRFAEAYLIRAEARIQQGKLQPGKEDLDVIRNRAGLAPVTLPGNIAAGMLQVEQERRVEFFAEWGHRWFDLKRWKSTVTVGKTRADDVLPATKPLWKSTAILMPIPTDVMRTNPNMVQNPGYN
ncbi:RagB/SusD family nutrient uptake outer membrane protein [Pedobacter nutrimenti]|uniref:RagB/SusD family nutrient uptake outer membrane protein n=1 Tax=Pedobacter nutrimenti TaxID=1241337 RepID=UPI00292FE2E6|nr:RagB/SusD family nutrient uptake outer membrane protein [Pedobacter nutrimenti]